MGPCQTRFHLYVVILLFLSLKFVCPLAFNNCLLVKDDGNNGKLVLLDYEDLPLIVVGLKAALHRISSTEQGTPVEKLFCQCQPNHQPYAKWLAIVSPATPVTTTFETTHQPGAALSFSHG